VLSLVPAPRAQGVVVLAGGGSEGNNGDTTSWSYRLYGALVANGDVDGDGTIRVAVVARETESAFIPNYFEWIGTTQGVTVDAFNVTVGSRAAADNPAVVGVVATADVVFLKGGDQGQYYDLWNGTLLETHIRAVAAAGGALGGTSAGAMSLAEHCLCGGQDLIGSDPMGDARSPYLDDATVPGTSSIHSDFLGIVGGVYVDTHATERGRLGRVLGVLAKATDDTGDSEILAVAIEAQTGVVLRNDTALVVGEGAVEFVHQTPDTRRHRDAGRPLVYTDLHLDRLADGWRYVVSARRPVLDPLPPDTEPVVYSGDGAANAGALTVLGSLPSNEQKFEWIAAYAPNAYALTQTTLTTFVRDAVGFTNVDRGTGRGDRQEALFRALYDRPNLTGFLLYGAYSDGGTTGGTLVRTTAEPDVASFAGDMAAIVIDGKTITHRGLAPTVNSYGLRSAVLLGVRVHVLAESALRKLSYSTCTHTLTGAAVPAEPAPTGSGAVLEVRPNPSSSWAEVRLESPGAPHVRVEVLDGLGRRVALLADGAASGVTTYTVDTSGLAAGVYTVRASGADETLTRRFVVAR